MEETMTKELWIEKAYQHLCKRLGAPKAANEERNLREWAALMVDCECNYMAEGYTPEDAVEEEIQAGL